LIEGGSSLQQGATVWFTGLSGAGKTTICQEVAAQLSKMGIKSEFLDGDEVRKHLSKDLGFNREDRIINIQRMAFICKILTRNQILVLASFLSPYQEMREYCRSEIDPFIEVYVKCPLEECIRTDVKGLYAKALSGEIKQFTGISDPYEFPSHPHLVLETDKETVNDSVSRVLDYLKHKGLIQ
jgi:adenylylsulfate kinase